MLGLAYASVPLYRMFCEATGFNGATIKADEKATAPNTATGKTIKIRFDANTNGIDWSFKPETPTVTVEVGKTSLAYFTVTNNADHAITGRATYNVLPDSMGGYFMKIQCFCFSDQTLKAGETKTFPMVFYLDPELLKDVDTKKVTEITLSYTFFESTSQSSKDKPS